MADRFAVSVVVPTYNRRDQLERCLRALREQDFDRTRYEIIVSDDGSTDGTDEMMRAFPGGLPAVRYVTHQNVGPAANRNIAIGAASGEIVLFIDDDVEAGQGLIAAHLKAHAEAKDRMIAVLGYTPIVDDRGGGPVMRYLDDFWERVYRRAASPARRDPWGLFISNNLSLRRSLVVAAGLFDETLPSPNYEDSELGYRLCQRGVRVLFAQAARAGHHVILSFDDLCARAFQSGRSAVIFWRKHPELAGTLSIRSAGNYHGPDRAPRAWHAMKRVLYNDPVMSMIKAAAASPFLLIPDAARFSLISLVLWHHTLAGMNRELGSG